ncbi:MAG: hypothetical protein MJ099_00570 [Clostridia bacterium]|nr:hypothetical protein [Clostridia bacterium]
MISCTEFIPSYSELFTYLENKFGHDEVKRFWSFLFEPDGKSIPLINFLKEEGIRGCYSYWAGTLNEEAADFTMYLNEKQGWYMETMHRCPSKGRLLQLKEEIGLEPYPYYCHHCDYYRLAAEKAGFKYIYNFNGIDHAACSMMIYDPRIFDGRIIIDEDTIIMDRKAADNEYFHRDFHSSMNNGMEFLGEKHGEADLIAYLTDYTKHVYVPVFKAIEEKGLEAIRDKIVDTYEKEKASEVLQTVLTDKSLTVEISACPAVKHLRETGREVSKWYVYSTTIVMKTLAEHAGATFTMESYDEATGAAKYRFDIA